MPDVRKSLLTAKLLVELSRRGRLTTRQAARHLEVKPRTAREHLQRLAEVVPIEVRGKGRDREWIVDPLAPLEHLSVMDRISLLLGRDLASFLEGTMLWEGLDRGGKLPPSQLDNPARHTENLDRKIRAKHEPARLYREHDELLDAVLDALLRGRRLTLVYRDEVLHDLEPLTLVLYRRAVYLLARPPGRTEVRRLAVERIRTAIVGSPFPYPDDWDPSAELDPWFGIWASGTIEQVELEFQPEVAHLVRARAWHPSAQLHGLDDGRVRLTMRTGGLELVRFVVEWGRQCRVIEPAWLRVAVADELREALAWYETVVPVPANQLRLAFPAARVRLLEG